MSTNKQATDSQDSRTRIDKWLWAARFFKTRSLAKAAIEGGLVQCEGQRMKVSRDVVVGMSLRVRQGNEFKTLTVLALSNARGPATQAQLLYEESEDSIKARQELSDQRKAMNLAHPDHKPNKKERRQIHRFQNFSAPS